MKARRFRFRFSAVGSLSAECVQHYRVITDAAAIKVDGTRGRLGKDGHPFCEALVRIKYENLDGPDTSYAVDIWMGDTGWVALYSNTSDEDRDRKTPSMTLRDRVNVARLVQKLI